MRIFFAGPLTDLTDPEEKKEFYKKLAGVAETNGFPYFWAFLSGTDPVKNPDVTPQYVYQRDTEELAASDVMVAYMGEPSTGTGIEIEYAKSKNIPVVIMYEDGKRISRMLRGNPAVKRELIFKDENDALTQFDAFLKRLKAEGTVA